MQMNRVEIAGYLVKKPEVRYLPSGIPVANARLGQTYRFQDNSQQWHERTNWHNLSFYGDLSKLAATFEKGENVFVEGTIEQREFVPKLDEPAPYTRINPRPTVAQWHGDDAHRVRLARALVATASTVNPS